MIQFEKLSFFSGGNLSTVGNVINFKIYLQLTFKAMADREKKKGRWKCKTLNISRMKRGF